MSNPVQTYGDGRLLSREGVVHLARIGGVPSPVLQAVLTLTEPDENGQSYLDLTLPVDPLPADVIHVDIVSHGFVDTVPASNAQAVELGVIEAMQAGIGTFRLGNTADFFGVLYGTVPTKLEMVLENSTGMGIVRDLWAYTTGESASIPPLVVISPPVLDPVTEAQPYTFDAPVFTGHSGVSYTVAEKAAKDATGLDEAIFTTPTGITPNILAPYDTFAIGAVFSGPGVPVDQPIVWSNWQAITPAAVSSDVVLTADAMPATDRVFIDNITNANFLPWDVITATGGKQAYVVAFVVATKQLFLGPITGGPIADNDALTTPSGGAALANGPSVPWQFTGGEAYYILPHKFVNHTALTVIQYIRDNSSDTAPSPEDLTGVIPAHYGSKQYMLRSRVSGPGIVGSHQDYDTPWIDIGVPALVPLADADWMIIVAAATGTAERVTEVRIKDSIITDGPGWWSTGSDAYFAANPFPTGREPTELLGTIDVDGTIWRRYGTFDAIYSGKNYTEFGTGDETRRTLFSYVVPIGGAMTPLGARKTVPEISTPTGLSDFHRQVARSEEWAKEGEVGGTGYQIIRCVGSDGDYLYLGIDVSWAAESDDFGLSTYGDSHDGLYQSQSFAGAVVDGKFVHIMVSGFFMSQPGADSSYQASEGIYRKDRTNNKYTKTHNLTKVMGSGSGSLRRNLQYITIAKGSGTGPDNRTVFAMHAPGDTYSTASMTTIQILKSTNGGASYANDGGTLNIDTTYGIPIGLVADTTALYMFTFNGVYRRAFAGTSWVKATGLPAGEVRWLEKHGTKVYCTVVTKGFYVANDAATLAFTALKTFDASTFSICPADTNCMVLIGHQAKVPLYTRDGGATWGNSDNQKYSGQPNDFAHALNGPDVWVRFHETNKNLLVAQRYQHMGRSTNGGATFTWAGRGYDGGEVRAAAYHPTDWRRWMYALTDRLFLLSEHGMVFVQEDYIDTEKDEIDALLGKALNAHSAYGALVIANGAHTGYIAQVGEQLGGKIIVIATRGHAVSFESNDTSTGNGTLTYAISPSLPCGTYTLTCSVAGGTGVGKFQCYGPYGKEYLGECTVGTEKVFAPARGGTFTVTIADGSVNFTAGTSPKVFSVKVEVMKDEVILDPATGYTVNAGWFGQVNPAVPYRGITGRQVFEISSGGVITRTRNTAAYDFFGYMGPSGNITLGRSSNSALVRSTNEGVSYTAWASGLGNFAGKGTPIIRASFHDDQRAYVGCVDGTVKRIQGGDAGTKTTIFSFAQWCNQNGVTGAWPGSATVVYNGVTYKVPPCVGVGESWYNPNLLYAVFYLFGGPFLFFRTKNALAATPVWENVSTEGATHVPASVKGWGLTGPLQSLFVHRWTDEIIIGSTHGTQVVRPEQSHIDTYSLPSMIDELRALPCGTIARL